MIIPGLHHITAISGPPQQNVDFYVSALKQRLVKKTVNFDDSGTYHLYYGDNAGTPGTILTFFPFVDAGPGRAGPGMASAFAYTLAPGGLDPLMTHLAGEGLDFDGPAERFGRPMITVHDPDGLAVEFIEADTTEGAFHSVTLWERDPDKTAKILTDIFGYTAAGTERTGTTERLRFASPSGDAASMVDIIRSDAPSIGRQGAGTIHHVAFRAETDEIQKTWQERVRAAGLDVTPVIDRQYFNAIYFREPGGVLFEIATDPPGFAVDEPVETMGAALKLPPRYEENRARIEQILPPLKVPA
ncbi:MAG: ring-cleaving dioxygenase [Pseudomonadota bacterium]